MRSRRCALSTISFLLLVPCALISSGRLYAYDRDAVLAYAREYSAPDGHHNPLYRLEELDCANFVSQCLIAGGIRFYTAQGVTLTSPFDADEAGTTRAGGAPVQTRCMASMPSDPKDYSRPIPGARHLPFSLFHKKHGGKRYEPPYNSSMWNDLEPGDTIYEHIDGYYFHCMLVSDVTPSEESLKFCGHTNWRRDADDELISEAINAATGTTGSNWKTGNSRIICLPDAPRVKEFTIQSGGQPIKWRWVTKLCVENYKKFASKADLVFKVTFDTNMNTQAPSIRLRVGTTDYSFVPCSDSGYTNGWWTSPTSGDNIRYRTWKGQILADDLPVAKNILGKILVRAKATDGSYNDRTNNLGKYASDTSMDCIRILLDTKTSRPNNPRSER